MIQKLIGAGCVLVAFGGWGLVITKAHKTEERALRQTLHILERMECELGCRATPLPQLFRVAAEGIVGEVLVTMSSEMENQALPNAESCMNAAMTAHPNLPPKTAQVMSLLGRSLGKFDLSGQLQELEAVKNECRRILEEHCANQENRLRSYRALTLCAGAVIAIMLL